MTTTERPDIGGLIQLDPTDLTPGNFVVPTTGEVIDVGDSAKMRELATSEPEIIGLMLDLIDDAIRTAQSNRAYISDFLVERMDADATQTLHAGGYTLTVNGSSDEEVRFDAEKLHEALSALVDQGVITQAAADKAVRVKKEAAKSGINSLRALRKDEIDAAIDAAGEIVIKRRRVSVKRA